MHTRVFPILLILLITVLLTACGGAIKGEITSKITGEPIEGVQVEIAVEGRETRRKTTTITGRYDLPKPPDVPGTITATKEGYHSYTFEVTDSGRYDFWMRPDEGETARRILKLQIAGATLPENVNEADDPEGAALATREQEKNWEHLWRTYIHPNYQAQYPLPPPGETEEKRYTLPSFIALLTQQKEIYRSLAGFDHQDEEKHPRVEAVETLENWMDTNQRKRYETVKHVTMIAPLKEDGEKTLHYYLVLSNEYWHALWIE